MWHSVPSPPNPEESFSFDPDYNPLFQHQELGIDGIHAPTVVFTVDINWDAKSGLADVTFSDAENLECNSQAKPHHLDIAVDTETNTAIFQRLSAEGVSTNSGLEDIVINSGKNCENQEEKGQGLHTENSVLQEGKVSSATSSPVDNNGSNVPSGGEGEFQSLTPSPGCDGHSVTTADSTPSLKRKDSRKRRATGGFFLKSPETGTFIVIS